MFNTANRKVHKTACFFFLETGPYADFYIKKK